MNKKVHIKTEYIKYLTYVISLCTFFAVMRIDNPQILRVSRTAIMVLSVYLISSFAAVYVFGGFDVGKRKLRDITNSLLLSQFMVDFFAYMSLMFMNTNSYTDNIFRFSSKKLLLIVVIIHIIEIVVLAYAANKLYFLFHAGETCCVITSENIDISHVHSSMGIKNIIISQTINYDDAKEWMEAIKKSDNVVIYSVPLEIREQIMEYAYKYDKNIYYNPNICDILEVTSEYQMFDDSLMFYSPKFELSNSQKIAKRTMDIVGSLVMIILSSPIWIICALMIKLDDHGRLFFRQDRATKGGKPFKIYKFRTMRDSDETNPMKANDDRVTKAGRIIRKTRMDELPQLINILKGDMSLVGPRPEQMKYIHGFDQQYAEYEYRLKVKAGLTGYAQIEGKYNTSNKDKLILDLMYIQKYSIWLDIKLLMQTLLVFFKKDSSEGF